MPNGSIVVAGEALMDLVLDPDGRLRAHPGGGPYNVARTVARLGRPAAYLGRLSQDRFGEVLRGELRADGVDLRLVVDTPDPTTLALAEIGAGGGASYRFYAAGTSAFGLTAARLPADAEVLCLGTLGLVFEPTAATLEALAGQAGGDVLVALDPNVRPVAITDEAAYRARIGRLLARADVLKASEEDLAWLRPGEGLAQAAASLARPGTAALVTLGGEGALLVRGEDVAHVPAPPVQVVDTIGAGDAFMGAFLAHPRDDLVAAAAFACRVAALTCARPGADPPRAKELDLEDPGGAAAATP